ncbi:MAG: cytochrome b/b6 domain-containing protein [Eggerthellaceae bacterium]|jgi:Ni/Fe-hydrogenase 1 B-type cytochrome subunit|nr:cytochrome b/b6 domain-containing protein [Eggerthellaceae bacterium]
MAHLAHYREAHPLPFVITHWVNLICMILLIISGINIHFPFLPAFEGVTRGIHMFCAFVIVINCIVRIVLAFVVKSAPTGGTRKMETDIKSWLPQADNRHQAGAWVKYYLFLKKDHPLSAKLGVPQKITYLLIPFLIIFMAYTGFCLWAPTMDAPLCVAGLNLVGGAMTMRIIHYFMMYVFICFMFIHVYLANVEGLSASKLMLLRQEHGGLVYDPETHAIVGEDALDETH